MSTLCGCTGWSSHLLLASTKSSFLETFYCALYFSFSIVSQYTNGVIFKASLYHTVGLASNNKHSKHSYNVLLNFSCVSISLMQRYLVMICTVSRALSSAPKLFGTNTGLPMKYWYLSHACRSTRLTCMHIYVVAYSFWCEHQSTSMRFMCEKQNALVRPRGSTGSSEPSHIYIFHRLSRMRLVPKSRVLAYVKLIT